MQGEPFGGNSDSALSLLRILATKPSKPEEFIEHCNAWDDLSNTAQKAPGFDEVADRLFRSIGRAGSPRPSGRRSPPSDEIGALTIDSTGLIVGASDAIRRHLGAVVGENIREYLRRPPATAPTDEARDAGEELLPTCIVEVIARSGRRFLCHCATASQQDGAYVIRLVQTDISTLVESYMRWSLGLTSAEVDIVRLLLRRYAPKEISEQRGVSLATVRTHIRSIIQKFKARSVTEVMAAVYELAYLPDSHFCEDNIDPGATTFSGGSLIKLAGGRGEIEYFRHGREGARPLVILPSVDYGVTPPKAFLAEAAAHGYAIYVLLRPGYGRSTPATSVRASADLVNAAIEELGLKNAVVLALSSAGPVGLQLGRICRRLDLLIVANYLMTESDKSEFAHPKWVRGLLDLSNYSPESFRFALNMTRGVIRLAGANRFIRSLYHNQPHDLVYATENVRESQDVARLLLGADEETVRLDITSSYFEAPDIAAARELGPRFAAVFGEYPHGVPPQTAQQAFAALGLSYFLIVGAGRNCAYQKPAAFFSIIERAEAQSGGVRLTASA